MPRWKHRYTVLCILSGAWLLSYADRLVIASAIPFIAREFQLSPLSMGGVLSAFFIGYSLMQIPGGVLADRFGPNRVVASAVAAWSLFTAATGMAGSLTALLAVRVLFGLSEGVFPPSAAKALRVWFPKHEIGRANGVLLAATQMGAFAAPLVVAAMVIHWGWRSVFLSMLLPGLVLVVLVRLYVKDSPQASKHVSSRELAEYDDVELAPAVATRGVVPGVIVSSELLQALRTPAIGWCFITLFFANTANWGLVNWLPTYLLEARGFSVAKMGVFGSLPFIAGAIGYCLSGLVSDRYFSKRRQVPILLGLLASGGLTYLASVAPSGEWAVAYLAVAFLFLHIAFGGIYTLPLVIVEQSAAGSAFGIVNTAGQLAALLSPLLVGAVLNATHSDFTLVFQLFVGFFLISAFTASRIRQLR